MKRFADLPYVEQLNTLVDCLKHDPPHGYQLLKEYAGVCHRAGWSGEVKAVTSLRARVARLERDLAKLDVKNQAALEGYLASLATMNDLLDNDYTRIVTAEASLARAAMRDEVRQAVASLIKQGVANDPITLGTQLRLDPDTVRTALRELEVNEGGPRSEGSLL